MKGVAAKKSLLSFHTIDGNHSFTIISVSSIPFQKWNGSYDKEVEGFSHTYQLFCQAKKLSHFPTELYCFGYIFRQDNCLIRPTVVMELTMLPYSKQNL